MLKWLWLLDLWQNICARQNLPFNSHSSVQNHFLDPDWLIFHVQRTFPFITPSAAENHFKATDWLIFHAASNGRDSDWSIFLAVIWKSINRQYSPKRNSQTGYFPRLWRPWALFTNDRGAQNTNSMNMHFTLIQIAMVDLSQNFVKTTPMAISSDMQNFFSNR